MHAHCDNSRPYQVLITCRHGTHAVRLGGLAPACPITHTSLLAHLSLPTYMYLSLLPLSLSPSLSPSLSLSLPLSLLPPSLSFSLPPSLSPYLSLSLSPSLSLPPSSSLSLSLQSIESGRNLVALSCSIKLVNAIESAEKRETPITDVRHVM